MITSVFSIAKTADTLDFNDIDSLFVQSDTSEYQLSDFECVQLDSLYWSCVDPCFIIFDSMKVDPYKVKLKSIDDSLKLVLYDSCLYNAWSMPLEHNYITSHFGQRHHRWHYGTDLRLSIGDTVRAAYNGVVRISKYNYKGYGNYVLVRHDNGLETLYGHLSKRMATVGQEIKAGECLGLGGNTGRSTGPHLHFEVRYKGIAIDPESFYEFESNILRSNSYQLSPEDFEYLRQLRKAVYYKIKSGDTLSGIAHKYHVPMSQICRLNNMSKKSVLRIGKTIRIR